MGDRKEKLTMTRFYNFCIRKIWVVRRLSQGPRKNCHNTNVQTFWCVIKSKIKRNKEDYGQSKKKKKKKKKKKRKTKKKKKKKKKKKSKKKKKKKKRDKRKNHKKEKKRDKRKKP